MNPATSKRCDLMSCQVESLIDLTAKMFYNLLAIVSIACSVKRTRVSKHCRSMTFKNIVWVQWLPSLQHCAHAAHSRHIPLRLPARRRTAE